MLSEIPFNRENLAGRTTKGKKDELVISLDS